MPKYLSFSAGNVKPYQQKGASRPRWRGQIKAQDAAGKWHTLTKSLKDETGLPIPCDGKTNKGKAKAMKALEAWREELLASIEQEAAQEALPQESALSVYEYVRQWIERRANNGEISGATIASYQASLVHLKGILQRTAIADLTPSIVQAWADGLMKNGVGPSARAKALGLLKRVCKHALEIEAIDRNPCAAVKPPKERGADPNPLDTNTLETLNAILEVRGHDPFTDSVRLALLTGMRQGEVCGLQWGDVDRWDQERLEGSTITVCHSIGRKEDGGHYVKPPKSGKARTIPVNEELADLLETMRARMKAECLAQGVPFAKYLYVTGKPVPKELAGEGYHSPQYLSKQWNMFAKSLGIKGTKERYAHFHDLRHTFATHAIAQGIDVEVVARILGHANVAITLNVYADALPEHKRAAMDKLGPILSQKRKGATIRDFRAKEA